MKKLLLCLLFFTFPCWGSKVDDSSKITDKLDQIKSYESLAGEWQGEFTIKAFPEELKHYFEETDIVGTVIEIKVILSENELPRFFKKTSSESEWHETDGEVSIDPDILGFHILVKRQGGVWIERELMSFSRLSEKQATMTYTRTVHNWYYEPNAEAPEYYYIFGSGKVVKQ